jgi:pilus assembly protein CpaB
MKKVVLFALIAALCAGALLYVYLGKLEQQKEVQIVYENVVVAAADIPAFTTITADMVAVKQVPQGSSHTFAARSADEVIGYVTEGNLIAGEEILPAKLKQPGQTESGLSYVVPAGLRAITIAVDEISGVAGFIQRGDYVDVIAYTVTSFQTPEQLAAALLQQKEEVEQNGVVEVFTQSTTVVAAQNILVGAVGTTLADKAATGTEGAELYHSVTLFVTPEDAMRIVQSAKSGIIILTLRATGDHAPNLTNPVVNDSLLEKAK